MFYNQSNPKTVSYELETLICLNIWSQLTSEASERIIYLLRGKKKKMAKKWRINNSLNSKCLSYR